MKDVIILINSKESIDVVKSFCLNTLRNNGFDIDTIVTKDYAVSIYYKYPWRKWSINKKIKKQVDKFDYDTFEKSVEKRSVRAKRPDTNAMSKKLLTRFTYSVVQGDTECRDGEVIINEQTNEVIGYKK